MLIRSLQALQLGPHSNFALILRNRHHSKTRFVLSRSTSIDSSELHQGIPRLLGVLLRCIGIHVRDLTSCTPGHDIEIQFVQSFFVWERGGDSDSFPGIFFPRVIISATDDDVGSESFDCQSTGIARLVPETFVQVFDTRFAGDLKGHDICEVVRGVFAIEFLSSVDGYQAIRRALVDECDVLFEEILEDLVDILAVLPAVGLGVPDLDGAEFGVLLEPLFGGESWNSDTGVSAVDGDLQEGFAFVVRFFRFVDAGVDQCH